MIIQLYWFYTNTAMKNVQQIQCAALLRFQLFCFHRYRGFYPNSIFLKNQLNQVFIPMYKISLFGLTKNTVVIILKDDVLDVLCLQFHKLELNFTNPLIIKIIRITHVNGLRAISFIISYLLTMSNKGNSKPLTPLVTCLYGQTPLRVFLCESNQTAYPNKPKNTMVRFRQQIFEVKLPQNVECVPIFRREVWSVKGKEWRWRKTWPICTFYYWN